MNQSVIPLIMLVAGLAMVIFSAIRMTRLKKCRTITGRVVDEVYEYHTDADGTTQSRFPVYEYEWQGQTHRYQSHASGGKGVGATVELYIDADGVIYEKRSAVAILIIGIVVLVMAVVVFAGR